MGRLRLWRAASVAVGEYVLDHRREQAVTAAYRPIDLVRAESGMVRHGTYGHPVDPVRVGQFDGEVYQPVTGYGARLLAANGRRVGRRGVAEIAPAAVGARLAAP
ncbi:hypothetical protein GCM10022251_31430 [Phytohabitans flavus]|uniref:Uncharacterized protein n=1 Tax=Phytohabitans flavus TaxID=1076124 RepID=A0A6F8XWN0_9ACTN|nr:hypothetical protein [Phytohabitans flavus]BCB78262.1 hypothetical protein Pflav_046720 [Phytohabitans flavus]